MSSRIKSGLLSNRWTCVWALMLHSLFVPCGMSIPRLAVPKTSLMALEEQVGAHAPWPMQCVGLIRTPLPLMIPKAVSGQARTQAPDPKQRERSTTGCNDRGSVRPDSTASLRTLAWDCERLRVWGGNVRNSRFRRFAKGRRRWPNIPIQPFISRPVASRIF